ncbi:PEP-CTERM protein-sorting domain-containing protein [Sphingomonas laterariae]|uniref:PEP-CTERM protein-sorting domain-containing protein n=1 Tax=Edaphosphingomonas laterariae TaxID=861865 RepID=A0A239HAM1_9SPHN|nr:PEPxxWA-CTERM sorting domain-containing protein [Sphingomonas laterariae]SNS78417.1 PEP-CTERM protein-sorting domain-containing protein [Sphingomonas laterariae]
MFKSPLMAAALAAAAIGTAPAAHATIIDFDNFTGSYSTGAYEEDGYRLSVAICSNICFKAVDAANSIDADGTSVVRSGGATSISVERSDGAAFRFGSMDFGKTLVDTTPPYTHSSTYEFTFSLTDGTQQKEYFTFLHNGSSPIATHTASFASLADKDITKFTFRNQSSAGQFDNIVLNDVAAVPEPATWAMMIGGFGMVGGALRRRRPNRAFA